MKSLGMKITALLLVLLLALTINLCPSNDQYIALTSGGLNISDNLSSIIPANGFTVNAALAEIVVEGSTTHTLAINYIYAGGDVATEPYTNTIAEGATYEVSSPSIGGFTPDKDKVSGTMGTEDVNVIVTYTQNIPTHTLTINYVYADGGEAMGPYTSSIAEGDSYDVSSLAIEGFTPDKDRVSGTMGTEDVTVTVTYAQNILTHALTVKYVYADGSKAVDDHSETVAEGTAYEVSSPSIEGFTPDKDKVSGTMGTEDVTVTVTYAQNIPTHALTVKYVYADGSKAVDDHSETVAEGTAYEVSSPSIEGFTPDKDKVSGTMGTEDVTVTVTYAQNIPTHALTVKYVYADGSKAVDDHSETVAEGTAYEVSSPSIEGFTPDKDKVSGTMGTADVTEKVTYTANHTHTYGEPIWAWAENHSTATASFNCTTNDDTQVVDAAVTSEVTAATCTEAGKTVFTAKVSFGGKDYVDTQTVQGDPATGHTYGEPVWAWAEDHSTATATFTCTANDNTQTVDAAVMSEVTAATCIEAGKTVFTAKVSFGGKDYVDTQTVPGNPATGHTYGEPVWAWAEDHSTATATFTCTANDNTQTVDAAVTSEATAATCTEAGKTVFTATAKDPFGKEYANAQTITGDPAIGHTYGEPVWSWMADFSTATATFTCAKGDDTQTLNATITSTPVSSGGTKYAATVDFSSMTYTNDAFDADVPRHTLTISYYDMKDKEIAEPYVAQVAEGATYSVVPPVLARLVPDKAVVAGTMGTKDIREEVTYREDKVTITFRSNTNNDLIATQTVWRGETTTLARNTFVATKCRFMGWNTQLAGGGTAYVDGAEITPAEDITLYAQWALLSNLSFNKNGASGSMDAWTLAAGQTITLPKPQFTPKKGTEFDSWNTKKDGSGTIYAAGAEFTMPAKAVTLFAMWKGAKANILFYSNGASGKMSGFRAVLGEVVTLPACTFTHGDDTFYCWSTTKDGLGKTYADGATITVDQTKMTLYAQWDGATAKVSFGGSGGKGKMNPIYVTIPATITLPECGYTNIGKEFTGWEDSLGEIHAVGDEIRVIHDITLKAKWTKAVCVVFDKNGGKGNMTKQYGLPGETITLNTNSIKKEGFRFVGWNLKKDGTGKAYADKGQFLIENANTYTAVKLYAQWIQEAKGELTLTEIDEINISKTNKLFATVMDGDKPVKGAEVTFSLPGLSEKAKTDKNGVVICGFSTSKLKNLPVGKKVKYTVTYAGKTITRRVLVVN